MGMFNNITCEFRLPGPYSKKMTGTQLQTKSIEPRSMDHYEIGKDKRLRRLVYDTVQIGTHTIPGLPGITFPTMKRANEHWVDVDFTGEVFFYGASDRGTLWHEYVATLKEGVLICVRKDMERSMKLGTWVDGKFEYAKV